MMVFRAAAVAGLMFLGTASISAAATLTECGSDIPDVGGTGGSSTATLYSGSGAPSDFDFVKGTGTNDAISSCTTVGLANPAQYDASDLAGIDGEDDWHQIFKIDTVKNSVVSGTLKGVTYSLDPLDGTFSFLSALGSQYSKILAVFKDGEAAPETIVAYGLSGFADGYAGSFVSMFFNSNDPTKWKDEGAISNFALFGVKDMTPIPLPAAGWLLLAGLGGLAAYGRKKRWA